MERLCYLCFFDRTFIFPLEYALCNQSIKRINGVTSNSGYMEIINPS